MVGFEPLLGASEPCCPTHCAMGYFFPVLLFNGRKLSLKNNSWRIELVRCLCFDSRLF